MSWVSTTPGISRPAAASGSDPDPPKDSASNPSNHGPDADLNGSRALRSVPTMSSLNTPYGSGFGAERNDPRRWLYAGLAVMFVLIGAAVLFSALWGDRASWTWGPWMMGSMSILGWIAGLFFLLLFIWVIVWIVRAAAWGIDGSFRSRHFYRAAAHWRFDPAFETARERYARGEITREQFDQIAADLDRRRNPGYP